MQPSRIELAVLNNVCWYQAMFQAQGLASEVDGRVWRSRATAPPFHSNLVVLAPGTAQSEVEAYVAGLDAHLPAAAWSLKDSYACLDLGALNFTALLDAEWIWREPRPSIAEGAMPRLAWARLNSATELLEWERAWAAGPMNDAAPRTTRQFPPELLASPDHAFFAGRLDGRIIAGGIANRSPGAVGLSNVFAPEVHAQDTWHALVSCIASAYPELPIVGYERGADLRRAETAGFESVGALRVWRRMR